MPIGGRVFRPGNLAATAGIATALCLVVSVDGRQAQSPASAKGTGFILGRVVDADSGRGIGSALVTLSPATAAPAPIGELTESRPPAVPFSPTAASGARRVLTAPDGRFLFRSLARGRYSIHASSSRYVAGAYGQLRPQGPAQVIELGDGEKLAAVSVTLWRFGSISGTIRDEHGEPAIGVSIECSRRVFTGGQKRFAVIGVSNGTDDRGMYRAANLPPGDYICSNVLNPSTVPVSVAALTSAASAAGASAEEARRMANSGASASASGARIGDFFYLAGSGTLRGPVAPPPDSNGRMMAYAPQYFGGSTTSSQAALISLNAGEERSGVDIQLKLVSSVRVSGMVIGPAGPVTLLSLRLVPVSGMDMASEGQAEFSRTVSDSSGAFTFLGVPAGDYVLKGRLYPRPAPGGNPLAALDEAVLWTATPVTVGSTDITNLTVQVHTGLRVMGRVEFTGARAQPTPGDLQRILIRMQVAEGRTSSPVALEGRVFADGTFKTSGYPSGRYIASVFANTAPIGWSVKSIVVGGRDVSVEPLELTDADVGGVVVTFTDRTTMLSGTVTGAKGPDPTAEVVVFPADSMAWKEIGVVARRGRVERVVKAGTFSITGLPPGEYFVAAVSGALPRDRQDPALLAILMRDAQRVTLADGGSATVQVAVKR